MVRARISTSFSAPRRPRASSVAVSNQTRYRHKPWIENTQNRCLAGTRRRTRRPSPRATASKAHWEDDLKTKVAMTHPLVARDRPGAGVKGTLGRRPQDQGRHD